MLPQQQDGGATKRNQRTCRCYGANSHAQTEHGSTLLMPRVGQDDIEGYAAGTDISRHGPAETLAQHRTNAVDDLGCLIADESAGAQFRCRQPSRDDDNRRPGQEPDDKADLDDGQGMPATHAQEPETTAKITAHAKSFVFLGHRQNPLRS